MTTREFLNALVLEGELADKRDELIAKLDAKNEKRASKPTKTQTANEPIKTAILEFLAENPSVASDIAKAVNVSTQKASSLCTLLVKEGKLTVADIKVKGNDTLKQYTIAE